MTADEAIERTVEMLASQQPARRDEYRQLVERLRDQIAVNPDLFFEAFTNSFATKP